MADEAAGSSPSRVHGKRLWCMVPERARIHMALTALQFSYAGQHVILRTVLNMGVSKLVFPVYRNIIALLLLGPIAYFLEKNDRPPLKFGHVMQFFLMGLLGITCNQGLYLFGLENTSPTFASAIENAVPAITFFMAALFRIEQVHLNRKDGKAKVLGTLASVAGALVITLYKGPTIYGPPSDSQYLNQSHSRLSLLGDAKEKNWTLGCICLIGHCLCWSSWIVLQVPVLKNYPARLSVSSFTCFFGILQCSAIAGIVERESQAWQIHSGGEVFAILYAGVVASAMAFAIQIWVIEKGGPVFVSVYLPLQTLLVALMASVILGEQFYMGGIIGAVLIVAGLYLVVWGKNEESKFGKERGEIPSMPADEGSFLFQSLLASSSK
ncbi:PREDICTED: protein WALLS ARE THIN 1-like [Fragaria vesca subsp. vesca]|uniref:protein WALLS ARE THIN 1-like n=1 Tax=Fragaria vesca subsp. vesca TaxID=101020 RepID=UPI0002C3759D|nr:PREDICTED: protein WALLS ARE THIN 1-like [Fragaria vesca subsp. vesca]